MKRFLLIGLLLAFFLYQQKIGVLLLVAFFFVLYATLVRKWPLDLEQLAGQSSADTLGWVRAVACGTLAICLFSEDAGSLSVLPVEVVRSYGVGLDGLLHDAYPRYFELFHDPRVLGALNGLSLLTLLLGCVGLATRVSLPLAALSSFILGGIHRSYTHFFHTGLLPWYVLLALCCLPCGDGFSIDGWLRRRRKQPVPDGRAHSSYYGAARHAALAPIALTYFATGLSKVRVTGVDWWSSSNIKFYFLSDTLNQIELGDWDVALSFVRAPGLLFSVMGAVGVLTELAGIFLLLERRTHKLLPFALVGLHVGIFLFQGFVFIDTLILPLAFLDPFRGKSSTPDTRSSEPARFVLAATAMCFFLSFGLRREFYPFSAWAMYSGNNSGAQAADYQKIFVETADGGAQRTDLSEIVGALSQGRELDLIHVFADDAEELRRAALLFDACGREANRRALYSSPVVAFRVELWHWPFAETPEDSAYGQRTKVYRHPLLAETSTTAR